MPAISNIPGLQCMSPLYKVRTEYSSNNSLRRRKKSQIHVWLPSCINYIRFSVFNRHQLLSVVVSQTPVRWHPVADFYEWNSLFLSRREAKAPETQEVQKHPMYKEKPHKFLNGSCVAGKCYAQIAETPKITKERILMQVAQESSRDSHSHQGSRLVMRILSSGEPQLL